MESILVKYELNAHMPHTAHRYLIHWIRIHVAEYLCAIASCIKRDHTQLKHKR